VNAEAAEVTVEAGNGSSWTVPLEIRFRERTQFLPVVLRGGFSNQLPHRSMVG